MLRLRISANDITPSDPGSLAGLVIFNDDHARRILAFVAALPADVEELVVACLHGESRSVAVAAALKQLLAGEPRPELLENLHIYDTIIRVAAQDRDAECPALCPPAG
jgi:predicted protein tyrosine phosphatase